jgi:uncharacterized membrane protein
MGDDLELFFSTKPAYPWSISGVGFPAWVIVAALLVFLTLWTYSGHPRANRRRLMIVITLRLLALAVVLLTALRPTIGVQEEPKIPSTLLIGIDMSESMSIKDEFGNQSRIDAVRKMLDRCQPILDDLKSEQNVDVLLYGFGSSDFLEASGTYNPDAPADLQRSDYGTYLARTHERWFGKKPMRGHLILGDGADNGTQTSPIKEAEAWRKTAVLTTFGVGSQDTPSSARDVALLDVNAEPNPVPTKTDFTLRLRAQAYGFAGANVPVKVQFDLGKGYQDVRIEQHRLEQERDNILPITLKAPELPEGKKSLEVKVRVEIPVSAVPGDVNAENNVIESFFTVTKDGLRVLVVDRYRYEYAFLLDTLTADRRINVRKVDLQTEEGGAGLREAFDFDENAYDVLILGNVTEKQISAIDPALPTRIADQVVKKGMGLIMLGGHATFHGDPSIPGATGWSNSAPIRNILPTDLTLDPAGVPAEIYSGQDKRYQVVLNPKFADSYLLRLGSTRKETEELWTKLNDDRNPRGLTRSRFTGLSPIGTPKPTADVLAYASDSNPLVLPAPGAAINLPPLLVAHQIGDGNRGRVICFAAQDTYLWQRLGQPKNSEGKELHARFWKQVVLWLAHQEEDDEAAFARPIFPRVPVGRKQQIRVGLKGKNGGVVQNPKFELQVIAPGEKDEAAPIRPVTVDADGQPIVVYDTGLPGEHRVKLVATGTTATGEIIKADASAKFIAYAEASEEMLRTAADYDLLKKIAAAGGGQFRRLDDLPTFLKELQSQPLETIKPRPRYYPDWRRNHSKGFLPAWLILFALLLGGEWALRRLWGMM